MLQDFFSQQSHHPLKGKFGQFLGGYPSSCSQNITPLLPYTTNYIYNPKKNRWYMWGKKNSGNYSPKGVQLFPLNQVIPNFWSENDVIFTPSWLGRNVQLFSGDFGLDNPVIGEIPQYKPDKAPGYLWVMIPKNP